MNKTNLVLFVSLLCCAVCFYAGWKLKPCPKLVREVITVDTVYDYAPITGGTGSPLTIITQPANTPKAIHDTTLVRDTVFVKAAEQYCGAIAVDTLRHDSLFVALRDSVTCYGIALRQATFGGSIKERTITNTITRTVMSPSPLLQINAGAQSLFLNRKGFTDVGPAVSVQLKNKHTLAYSYLVFTKQHSLTLTTKIK